MLLSNVSKELTLVNDRRANLTTTTLLDRFSTMDINYGIQRSQIVATILEHSGKQEVVENLKSTILECQQKASHVAQELGENWRDLANKYLWERYCKFATHPKQIVSDLEADSEIVGILAPFSPMFLKRKYGTDFAYFSIRNYIKTKIVDEYGDLNEEEFRERLDRSEDAVAIVFSHRSHAYHLYRVDLLIWNMYCEQRIADNS